MLKPEEMYQTMLEVGEDWADKKAAYHALDDLTKTVLAACKGRYQGTVDHIDSKARIDTQYKDHLKSLSEARSAFLMADAKYTAVKALMDFRRSEAAMERAMMERGVLSGGA